MSPPAAYIIAARRSAIGRIGGLHRNRRLDALAAPVIEAVLGDASIAPDQVEELLLGNSTEGANPARLVALAAGLPETISALTIDRRCASGLDAIVAAIRTVASGAAEIVVAGGAESLSTAPWRIARPRNPFQTPHFINLDPTHPDAGTDQQPFATSQALADKLGITRLAQDELAFASHTRAEAAREARRFVGEIVALRANAEEMRDQNATAPELEEFSEEIPFRGGDGTLTPANTSPLTDGAAFAVVVSEAAWQNLGKPPALRLLASAALGVAPAEDAFSPIHATRRLLDGKHSTPLEGVGVIEMSETSAAQVIAYAAALHIDPLRVSPEGGAVVRGHPLGAAGAILVTRLFTALVRNPGPESPAHGLATLGALGGIGAAALFERV